MKKTLMHKTSISEFMSVGCELDLEGEEIGFYIASADVSAAIAFKPDEWDMFCAAVKKIDKRLRERGCGGESRV